MVNNLRRTIEEVLNLQTGEVISATEFFKKSDAEIYQTRRQQEEAIQARNSELAFVCLYCKQILKIKGKPGSEGKTTIYFSHVVDSEDCAIKTNGKFTKDEVQRIKYNGAKESLQHIESKNFIAEALQCNESQNKGVKNVKIEKIFKDEMISKDWKKPDVQCTFFDKRLVFELQLSTTFLSVIVQRENFYKIHKTQWFVKN